MSQINKNIKIPLNLLKIVSVLTLLIPVFIFLFSFLRWYIGIPFCICLLISFLCYAKKTIKTAGCSTIFGHRDNDFSISLFSLVCCIAVAAAWAILSGIGGRFSQSMDFHGRNAIYHDLLNHSWPVYFEDPEGSLTYFIGFWLLPAVGAKMLASLFGTHLLWKFANGLLLIQTVWYLSLIFILMLSLFDRHSHVICILLLFVFFSGMDGLMCFLQNNWTDHLEQWAVDWQYSSMTTCLFWVFNQAVPAWLVVLLLLHSIEENWSFIIYGTALVIFAPLPLIGIFVFCAVFFIIHFYKCSGKSARLDLIRETFTPGNLLAVLSVIPVLLYLTSNNSVSSRPFHVELFSYKYTIWELLRAHLIFGLVEWGAFALAMLPEYRKDPLFITTCLSLMVIPWFKIGGYNNDFVMRSSIPALTVLSVYCTRYLLSVSEIKHKSRALFLAGFLAIGLFTPMTEFKRGIDSYVENKMRPFIRDEYKTVLSEYADTNNFVCQDLDNSLFYQYFAKPAPYDSAEE